MIAAVRQSEPAPSDEWVRADEAARLYDIPARTVRWYAKQEDRNATREGRKSQARKEKPTGGGRGVWKLSPSLVARLGKRQYPTLQERADGTHESLLLKHPEHKVIEARTKWRWYQEWRRRIQQGGQLADAELAQNIVSEARDLEGPDFAISVRSLCVWHKKATTLGADGQVLGIEALVDTRGRKNRGAGRSPEAIAYFYELYYTQAKHSARTCHDATVLEAKRQRWQWPPCYTGTTRWLRETENLANSCLYRQGQTAYSKRYMQHLELDRSSIQPGERYVADHTTCDFWVDYRGKQIRPWLTALLDERSRCIVGWHLGVTPQQDSILAAMGMAFRDWAVPEQIHIDRGKDFASKLINGYSRKERLRLRGEHGPKWREAVCNQFDTQYLGILGELSVRIAEATPYHSWAKGQIERWFGTYEDQCGRTFITYCANKPENRAECVEELRAGPDVPTLEEARERIGQWIDLYHRRPHRGDGMDGKAPLAVWATAERLRKAADLELLAIMHTRGVYRVTANGVHFRVGNTELGYGATSIVLRQHVGRDVLITLDPEHCECCYAYTPQREDRRFIARLDCNRRIPVNTSVEELREAIRALRSRNKHVAQAQGEAWKRMRTAGQEVAALRVEQLAESRKTGTYDASARPAVMPLRTGFEGTSIGLQTIATRHVRSSEPGDVSDLLPTPAEEAKRERERQARDFNHTDAVAELLQPDYCDAARRLADFIKKPEPVVVYDSPWERLKAFNARETP